MASINTQNFTTMVQNMVTAVQAMATAAINVTIGSVLRALLEAVASLGIWLEAQIAYVLTITRAATSNGPDLDSYVNDFGLYRLAAISATGNLTFGRFSTVGQAVVPINSTIQSADGTQNYFVTLDTTNPNYSASLGGYVMSSGISSVVVPSQAVTPGVGANVLAGSITVITNPIPGVDTVTNVAAFTNGMDAESDADLRTRFVLFINSLSKAIKSAIQLAVMSVQQGIRFTLTENYSYYGVYQPGFFYVVIDDGTGTPPDSLVYAVQTAIEAVRGLTINYAVFKTQVLTANVSMALTVAPGYDENTVLAAVGVALTNFINALNIGVTLPYTQLAAIAYGIAGVQNVNSVSLNSGTSDLVANQNNTIKAGTIAVS